MAILIGLFILLGVGGLIAIIYKVGESFVALSREPIECPVCGRKINIVGNSPRCYKCRSQLIKHKDGHYIKG